MELVVEIYRVSATFPKHELYGLTGQIRRAAISVPSNVAEGQCRASSRDFLRYLRIAQGSLGEVETQLMIASRLTYIEPAKLSPLLDAANEVGRLIRGLSTAIERRITANAGGTSH